MVGVVKIPWVEGSVNHGRGGGGQYSIVVLLDSQFKTGRSFRYPMDSGVKKLWIGCWIYHGMGLIFHNNLFDSQFKTRVSLIFHE